MNLSNKDKKYVLNEYLRNISHISDQEYQQRVWIQKIGPECQAFDDAVCDIFDIGMPILDNYKEFGVTDVQYHLLKQFRDAFEVFSDNHDWPPYFIDTPEWQKIMEMAQTVLDAFHYKKMP